MILFMVRKIKRDFHIGKLWQYYRVYKIRSYISTKYFPHSPREESLRLC